MTIVDGPAQLAAIIRSQIRTTVRPGRGRQVKKVVDSDNNEPVIQKNDIEVIHKLIEQRILAIADDDPLRRRKAFRVFLESVLLQEFGTKLVGNTDFQNLVEQVQIQMESDHELNAVVEVATSHLLEQIKA